MNNLLKLVLLLVFVMPCIVYSQQCTALGLIYPQNLENVGENTEVRQFNNTNIQEIENLTIIIPTSFSATKINKNNLTFNNLTYNISTNIINSSIVNSSNISLINTTYNITNNTLNTNLTNFTINYSITIRYNITEIGSNEQRMPFNYMKLPFTDAANNNLVSNFLIKNTSNFSSNNIPFTIQNGSNQYNGPAALLINSTIMKLGKFTDDVISVNVNETWYQAIGDLGNGDINVFRLIDFNSSHLCYKLVLARPGLTTNERCFPKSNAKIGNYYLYNISYVYSSHIHGFDGTLFWVAPNNFTFPSDWRYAWGDYDFRFFHTNVSNTYYLTFITNYSTTFYFRTVSQGSYTVHSSNDANYRLTVYSVTIANNIINFTTIFSNASSAQNFTINYNTYLNEKNTFQSNDTNYHITILTLFDPLVPYNFSSHGYLQMTGMTGIKKITDNITNINHFIHYFNLKILNLSIDEQQSTLNNITYYNETIGTFKLEYNFTNKIINDTITEEINKGFLYLNNSITNDYYFNLTILNITKNSSHNLSLIRQITNNTLNTFKNEINFTYISNKLNIPFNALFNTSTNINQSRSYYENNKLYEYINTTHLRIYDFSSTNKINKTLLSTACQNKNINNDITNINQFNQFHECYSRIITLDPSNSSELNNTYSRIADLIPNRNSITFYKASKQPETTTNLTQFCKANILYANSLILPEITYYPSIRQIDAIYFYPYNENYEVIIGNNTATFLYDKETNQWYYIPPITCTTPTTIPVSAYVLTLQQTCGNINEQTIYNLFSMLGFIMNNIQANCNINVNNVQCTFNDNSGMVENFRIQVYDIAFNQNKLLCTAYGTTSATCSSANSSILVDVAFLYQGQYYHFKQFTKYKQPSSFFEPRLLFIIMIGIIFLIFGAFAYSSQALLAVIFLLGLISTLSIFTLDFGFIVVISVITIIFFILMNRKSI